MQVYEIQKWFPVIARAKKQKDKIGGDLMALLLKIYSIMLVGVLKNMLVHRTPSMMLIVNPIKHVYVEQVGIEPSLRTFLAFVLRLEHRKDMRIEELKMRASINENKYLVVIDQPKTYRHRFTWAFCMRRQSKRQLTHKKTISGSSSGMRKNSQTSFQDGHIPLAYADCKVIHIHRC